MTKKKILVIDDETNIRFVIENTLNEEFDIHALSNGREGLNYLEAGNFPDFIICDLVMPELNGFEFLERIKASGFFNDIPVMILSGREWSEDKIRCFELGADDYVVKPFNPSEVIARIKRRIGVRERYLNIINHLSKPVNDELECDQTKDSQHKEEEEDIKNFKNKNVRPYKAPFIKRTFDIFFAFFMLILLSPILIIVAIAIRIESKGKIVYKSKRVGANYKIFNIFKFRSMYSDADKRLRELAYLNLYTAKDNKPELLICPDCSKLPEGLLCSPAYYCDGERICENLTVKRQSAKKAFVKIQNDPRITKVGRFIRNTSIDELPQLINVLRGEMSIVGNRPLPVYEAAALTRSRWAKRFRTAAGITGLWQVKHRKRGGLMSEKERFILDYLYAKKNSFWNDIYLLLSTIPVLYQKTNA